MAHESVTLSQAIEGYFLAAHARRLSHHTLADYDNTFRKLEAFLGHDPPLADITPDHIRRFLSSRNGVSAKTLRNYYTGLSALWTWAVKEGVADEHIIRQVDAPQPETRAVVPYTERELKAMLAACDRSAAYTRPGKATCDHSRPTALRDRAIIKLLVDTGVRASELCNARICDLNLTNRRLVVTGKGHKDRMIPFSARTAQAIWRYLATRPDNDKDSAPLFATGDGDALSRHVLRRLLNRIGHRAGVAGVNVHRFRHTFAIQVLRNGGSVFALQDMLGHSTLDMVRRYVRIAETDIERAHQEASPVSNWRL